MFKLELKSKLILLSVMLGVIPATIIAVFIGWISLNEGRTVLEEQAVEKLIAQREVKKSEIERYFGDLKAQVQTFSNDRMIIDAMKEFKHAFEQQSDELNVDKLEDFKRELKTFYDEQFLKKYKTQNLGSKFDVQSTLDSLKPESIALQHNYILANPNLSDEKDSLTLMENESEYSKVHAKYHPFIDYFLQTFEFYDIFLVELERGEIIYSVFKEVDYTTSLIDGPYANSGIGQAFRLASASTDPETVILTDFAPYTPSYEDPAAFIASPIYDQGVKLGVLIFQMPIDRINEVMSYQGRWQEQGMGKSGETYLIGEDLKMRSLGRAIVENKQAYLEGLKKANVDDGLINLIKLKDTTIGLHKSESEVVNEAIAGESGTAIFTDYRGKKVVSAYAPLSVEGLKWAILSDVDGEEAFAAVTVLKRKIILWSLLGILFVGIMSAAVGLFFARFIFSLIDYVVGTIEDISADIDSGKCDLSKQLEPARNPVGARLTDAINMLLLAFAKIIKNISTSSGEVSDASERMFVAAKNSKESTQYQSIQVEQVATAMDRMTRSVQEVAMNASNGANTAKEADQEFVVGSEIVQGTIREIGSLARNVGHAADVIQALEKDSDHIGSVLGVIQDITEQTNLLALNATIEAARAGEQGLGFAVVANEVRLLANCTQESTQKIQHIIEDLQANSKEAVKVMALGQKQAKVSVEHAQEAGNKLKDIATKISELEHLSTQIAVAANQQSDVAEEINRSVVHINEVSETNVDTANHSSSESQALSSLAKALMSSVAGFKVK